MPGIHGGYLHLGLYKKRKNDAQNIQDFGISIISIVGITFDMLEA
jgi:hypothetical protein